MNTKKLTLIILSIALLVFSFQIVIAANTNCGSGNASCWVSNPSLCTNLATDNFEGWFCTGSEKVCGKVPHACYDTSTIAAPSTTGVSNTQVYASLGPGYILDCFANDGLTPLCNNNPSTGSTVAWCNANTTCNGYNRNTNCTASTWSQAVCGNCFANWFDCNGDGQTCEVNNGTTCLGNASLHSTYNGGCSGGFGTCTCLATGGGWQDCDSSGTSLGNGCEINTGVTGFPFGSAYNNTLYAGSCGSQCAATWLDCNGLGNGNNTNGCEVKQSTTQRSGWAVNHTLYGTTCSAIICDPSYYDFNGVLHNGNNSDGCEILIGEACTSNTSIPGACTNLATDTGFASGGRRCNCNETPVINFQTSVKAIYNSPLPLLMGQQNGPGLLLSLSNGSNTFFNITNGACLQFRDGTLQCSGSGSGNALWAESGNHIYSANVGNVGIGTSSPSQKLDVNGSAVIRGDLNVSGTSYFGAQSFSNIDTSGNLKVGSNTLFANSSSGNVGIGTSSPQQKLVVVGDLNVTGMSYLGNLQIAADAIKVNNIQSLTGDIVFKNGSGSEIVRFAGNGNVGVGTVSPAQKLDILGGGLRFSEVVPPGSITSFTVLTDGGNLYTGVYHYKVSFVFSGGETALGNVSSDVVTSGGANRVIDVGLPISVDPSVTGRNVYRTQVNGGTYYLLMTIPNNTDSIFYDNVADYNLGPLPPAQGASPGSIFFGSAQVMQLASTGKVGIGTSNISAMLTVNATNINDNLFGFFKGVVNDSNHVTFSLEKNLGHTDLYSLGLDTNTVNRLVASFEGGAYRQGFVFSDGNISTTALGISLSNDAGVTWNPAFVIKQNGQVGIGTSSPSSLLTVEGLQNQVEVKTPSRNSTVTMDSRGTAATVTVHTVTGGAYFQLYRSNGSVEVGQRSQVVGSVLVGALTASSSDENGAWQMPGGIFLFTDDTTNSSSSPGKISFRTTASGSTSMSERMVIKNNGFVGINTSTPTQTLTVRGDLNVTGTSYFGAQSFSNIDTSGNLKVGSTTLFANSSSGNVGIGTTSPTSPLTINGSGTVLKMYGPTVLLQSDNVANYFYFHREDSTPVAGNIINENIYRGKNSVGSSILYGKIISYMTNVTSGSEQGQLIFDTYDSGSLDHRLTIKGGNVGIGTITPSSTLNVVGDLNVTGTSYLGNIVLTADEITTNTVKSRDGNISFKNTSGNEIVRITSDGFVGVGTSSPNARLDVNGNVSLNNSLFVSENGRVGIGTSVPGDNLHVRGLVNSSAYIRVEGGVGGYAGLYLLSNLSGNYKDYWLLQANADKKLYLFNKGTNPDAFFDKLMTWDASTGFVGIGTSSPGQKLDVNGSAVVMGDLNVTGTSYLGNIVLTADEITANTVKSRDGNISFKNSSGSELVRVLSNGYVGIGTSSPNYLLTVHHGTDKNIQTRSSSGTGAGVVSINDATNAFMPLYLGGNPIILNGENDDGSYNVGIGTKNPSNKFHLNGSSDVRLQITNNVTGGGSTDGLHLVVDYIGDAFVIQREAANLKLYTSNTPTNGITINSVGRVGIGTSTPSNTLHVSGGGVTMKLAQTGQQNSEFYVNNSMVEWILRAQGATASPGIFQISDASNPGNGFVIQNKTGNVGIGTTNPSYKLDISDVADPRIHVKDSDNNVEAYMQAHSSGVFMGAQSNHNLSIGVNAGTNIFIKTDGNVGIGSTNPGALLEIAGANPFQRITSSSDGYTYTRYGNSVANSYVGQEGVAGANILAGASPYAMVFNQANVYPMQFGTSNTIRMTITSGGNLGIGTTSPTQKLDVAGATNISGTLTMTGASIQMDNGQNIYMKNTGGILRSALVVDGANNLQLGGTVDNGIIFLTSQGNERMRIINTGNVGIGTSSPGEKLSVSGNLSTTEGAYFATSSGYVGIGTSSPVQKMEVAVGSNGAVRISGYPHPSLEFSDIVGGNMSTKIWYDTTNGGLAFAGDFNSNRDMIIRSGKVGINTTTPTNTLTVKGDLNVTGTSFLNDLTYDGDLKVVGNANVTGNVLYGGNLTGYGADFAETFAVAEDVSVGDVVCLNEEMKVKKCSEKAQTSVVGVVSENPTIIGNGRVKGVAVGIVGIVKTKVKGPVARFDLLTSSSVPGFAEKASSGDVGAVIGKALEPCRTSNCVIKVLVGLR